MDRNRLIAEVKSEYARLADMESRSNFTNIADGTPPEAYYEKLLNTVLTDIDAGKFDSCKSGIEIVEKVANDKGNRTV